MDFHWGLREKTKAHGHIPSRQGSKVETTKVDIS